MTQPRDEETDRAISRRVEHATTAQAGDQDVYAAADASADPGPGATTERPADSDGTADRAAAEPAGDEPTRSE